MGNHVGGRAVLMNKEEGQRYNASTHVVLPHFVKHDSCDDDTQKIQRPTWTSIEKALQKPISSVDDFNKVVKEITLHDFNSNFLQTYLHYDYNDSQEVEEGEEKEHDRCTKFFNKTLPTICQLALKISQLFPVDDESAKIPLLLPQQNQSVTLTQEQIACLLASTFMGTLWI